MFIVMSIYWVEYSAIDMCISLCSVASGRRAYRGLTYPPRGTAPGADCASYGDAFGEYVRELLHGRLFGISAVIGFYLSKIAFSG